MLKRLPTAFAQVKLGDTSENLLNEIRQIKFIELCIDLCIEQKKLLTKYLTIL